MERLTIKFPNGYLFNLPNVKDEKAQEEYLEKLSKKLGQYEDAEEQGQLLMLPCKVGDTIWDIDLGRLCAYRITGFSFGKAESYIDYPVAEDEIVYYYINSIGSITGSFASSEIGKTLFLTKEAAEQALKQNGV